MRVKNFWSWKLSAKQQY